FWCARRTNYTVTDDRGQYNYRVKHASLPEYIPYTLSYNPTTGTGGGAQNPITLNISATFVGSDYINAVVGAYTDTVTLIVNP
ncbi:MAG: hypothetical protein N3A59_08660, partial [Thermodesulfovibrionales bacterium]|nr:hypothetical protein [Thermodesulfovibrionales bacterium]